LKKNETNKNNIIKTKNAMEANRNTSETECIEGGRRLGAVANTYKMLLHLHQGVPR